MLKRTKQYSRASSTYGLREWDPNEETRGRNIYGEFRTKRSCKERKR